MHVSFFFFFATNRLLPDLLFLKPSKEVGGGIFGWKIEYELIVSRATHHLATNIKRMAELHHLKFAL